jgi:hypothetical protein
MNRVSINSHTYSNEFTTITFDINNDDWSSLHATFVIGILDPLLYLTTCGGAISGQLELDNGIPTGTFRTIDGLSITRSNGTTRCIPLLKYYVNDQLFGYIPQVNLPCTIGPSVLYLTQLERAFYGRFVFTEQEPTVDNIINYIR